MTHRLVPARTLLVLALLVLIAPLARAASLPAGWATADVGAVAVKGSTAYASDDVFQVKGAGADIWDAKDEFRFVYHQLTGDGEIVARVDSLQAVDSWTKAGVMMRESLAPGARHAFMLASVAKGFALQYRSSANGASRSVSGGSGAAHGYVRLTRSGSTFTAYRSADGLAWTKVGTASISMPSTIVVGLAVSSHAPSRSAAAEFSHLTVNTSLSSGWKTADVGAVGAVGTGSGSTSDMTLKGAGADVWGRGDSFRFAYTMLKGDGEIVARVASIQNVDGWTKAGVMMRESLAAGSKHAFMLLSAGRGYAFQRRTSFQSDSASTSGGSGAAPGYVRLVRRGSTFTAYKSSNGSSWTSIGSTSISMVSTIYVGVAVTSHADPTLASARFTGIAITAGTSSSSGSSDDDLEVSPPPSAPADQGSSTSTATLRFLHWNLHHGVGTDGKYDIDRIATWIAKEKPDVVSLNEVEKYTGWGNEDQPARYKALLEAKTGRKWYYVWAQEYGSWDSHGKGNLLLSRFPLQLTARYALSNDRTVALGQVIVNGRTITVATTHLDPDSGSRRLTQAKQLLAWFDDFAEARIVAGDMNAQPTSTEMTLIKQTYTDGWDAAKKGGYAYAASDNPNGYTRHSRIDFVFTSKKATVLKPTRVEVIDARDSNGVMPSDHRPVLSVFTVQ
jgi:endonuclease/exonuclease/phosphatase family metal-dependent hydrolase/regulation of enolase protein 1 (concanavalin A-like superfamily)